jgi:N-acetyl-anhydromuramyl-L-alanine amidase AmpD
MLLKRGDNNRSVGEIQASLKDLGYYNYKIDNDFGGLTESAVKEYQKDNGLDVDGKVGPLTYAKLIQFETDSTTRPFVDNDGLLNDMGSFETKCGLKIHKMYLDTDEYVTDQGTSVKNYLFIHHTAGRANPYKTVKAWNNDSRGRVATQFCIGGIGMDGDDKNDGVVVECFPDEYFAWHLGGTGSQYMHKHSVGIEINNWGYLTEHNGKFYAWPAKQHGYKSAYELPADQVVDLGEKFLGHRYYHKYTDKQIDSLSKLIKEIKRRHSEIDFKAGLPELLKTKSPIEAFGFNNDAYYGKLKGILSHTNVRRDKTDVYPDERIITILESYQ